MAMLEQVADLSLIAAVFMLAMYRWKFLEQNKHGPHQHHCAENKIRIDDAHRLKGQIGLVSSSRLHCGNFVGAQLNAREDEDLANEYTGNRAQRIEGLRKVQPLLGCLRRT